VDPPAIYPYLEYINYLEDVVIFDMRQELASALASLDPTSTNSDDGPVTRPMVVKTNTGCEDEYCCCPCHGKDNTPPATPPSDPTPPRQVLQEGNAVAHGVEGLGPRLAAPTAVGHGVLSLTPWATTIDVYFCKICDGPYIFAKS
jgi:hypothetical protein